MTQFYINTIPVSSIIAKCINNEGVSRHFDNSHMGCLELSIDGYKDEDIALIFIMNRGKIYNDMNCPEIMIQIMIKYPEYVFAGCSYLEDDIIDIYVKYATANSILAHYDLLLKSIGQHVEFDGITCTINMPEKWYPIVYHFKHMWHIDERIYLDIPEGSYIEGNKIILSEHPYGYNTNMTVISDNDMLEKVMISNDMKNIYINCDVSLSINEVLHYAGMDWPDASVFDTWRIGAKCTELQHLFENCPYEPHIYSWNVSTIRNINNLFCGANVHDLSMLNFKSCRTAFYGFKNSNIKVAPQFPAIEMACRMFHNSNIETVSMLNSETLIELDNTFQNCIYLKEGFNNCNFVDLNNVHHAFSGCISLESAFNNCKFHELDTMDYCFFDCISLKHALNNCTLPKCTRFYATFKNAIGLVSALNNCTFTNKKLHFKSVFHNTHNLETILSNAGTLTIKNELIFSNCLKLQKVGCRFNINTNNDFIFEKCPELRVSPFTNKNDIDLFEGCFKIKTK